MFREASALETIYVSDDFVTTSVTSGSEMFENNYNLVGGNGTAANGETHDASYARIDKPGIPGYFTAK